MLSLYRICSVWKLLFQYFFIRLVKNCCLLLTNPRQCCSFTLSRFCKARKNNVFRESGEISFKKSQFSLRRPHTISHLVCAVRLSIYFTYLVQRRALVRSARLHRTTMWDDDRQAAASERARRARNISLQFPSNCIAKSKHLVEARSTYCSDIHPHSASSYFTTGIRNFAFLSLFIFPAFLTFLSLIEHFALVFRTRLMENVAFTSYREPAADSCDGPISCRGRYATVRENPMKNEPGQIVHGAGSPPGWAKRVIREPRRVFINPADIGARSTFRSCFLFVSFSHFFVHDYLSVK